MHMETCDKTIKVAHIEKKTQLLGPFDRFVIWVHGCCFDCPGCLADNTKVGEYQSLDVETLCTQIVNSDVEGITFSGGEPFLQADLLADLVEAVERKRDLGVICYSGFTLEELQNKPEATRFLKKLDVLIDGKYVRELDYEKPYVGSINQKIYYLTSRYAESGPEYYSAGARKAEIRLTSNQAILIGVPSKQTLQVWKTLKEKAGGVVYDFGS